MANHIRSFFKIYISFFTFRFIKKINKYFYHFIAIGEVKSVAGTEFDLRTPVRLGDRLGNVPGGTGFDHSFVIGEAGKMKFGSR